MSLHIQKAGKFGLSHIKQNEYKNIDIYILKNKETNKTCFNQESALFCGCWRMCAFPQQTKAKKEAT